MSYLESRVAACKAEVERNEAALAHAISKEGEAADSERRANAAADAAGDSYANDQTPEAGRALLDARESLALATAAHEARVRARLSAENSVAVARSALEDALARAEAERVAARKAELLPLANPCALTEKVTPHFARILEIEREAQAAIEAELDAVATAYEQTNAASQELREELGERAIMDIEGHTIVLGAIKALLDSEEFTLGHFDIAKVSLGGTSPIFGVALAIHDAVSHGVSTKDALLDIFAPARGCMRGLATGPSNRVPHEIEAELDVVRSARTLREARAMLDELRQSQVPKAVQIPPRPEGAPVPPPARPVSKEEADYIQARSRPLL